MKSKPESNSHEMSFKRLLNNFFKLGSLRNLQDKITRMTTRSDKKEDHPVIFTRSGPPGYLHSAKTTRSFSLGQDHPVIFTRSRPPGHFSLGQYHPVIFTRPRPPGHLHLAEITRSSSLDRNHPVVFTWPRSLGRLHSVKTTRPSPPPNQVLFTKLLAPINTSLIHNTREVFSTCQNSTKITRPLSLSRKHRDKYKLFTKNTIQHD